MECWKWHRCKNKLPTEKRNELQEQPGTLSLNWLELTHIIMIVSSKGVRVPKRQHALLIL